MNHFLGYFLTMSTMSTMQRFRDRFSSLEKYVLAEKNFIQGFKNTRTESDVITMSDVSRQAKVLGQSDFPL